MAACLPPTLPMMSTNWTRASANHRVEESGGQTSAKYQTDQSALIKRENHARKPFNSYFNTIQFIRIRRMHYCLVLELLYVTLKVSSWDVIDCDSMEKLFKSKKNQLYTYNAILYIFKVVYSQTLFETLSKFNSKINNTKKLLIFLSDVGYYLLLAFPWSCVNTAGSSQVTSLLNKHISKLKVEFRGKLMLKLNSFQPNRIHLTVRIF